MTAAPRAATCGYSNDYDPEPNGIPDECEGVPTSATFTTTADFTAGPFQQGRVKSINLDPDAVDQLQRSEQARPLPFLWVAASVSGTVVKIDTTTGSIRGEYYSSPAEWIGSPPETTYTSKYPSRTAVNLDGEVWVGNRGEDAGSGSVVKIGLVIGGTDVNDVCFVDNRVILEPPFEYNTCVDRDGDGYITTSASLLPLPWPNTDGEDSDGGVSTAVDECIIQYVRAGGVDTRYVAVDNDNNVWVGSEHSYNKFELLDGFTGELLERFGAPSTFAVNCGGFGGIVDGNNVLWSANQFPHGERMFRYDTAQDIHSGDCCEADMLTDSNNDYIIDAQDEAVEEDSPGMYVYLNEDDDDDNGEPDVAQEGPIDNEDDLLEILLRTQCDLSNPGSAEWWVQWEDPVPPTIKIWTQPDKSNGAGGAGQALVNNHPYPWPPPTSLWVEAVAPMDDLDITFTISLGGSRGPDEDRARIRAVRRMEFPLRVVALTEPLADLDYPPDYTGGCKLTRTEIKSIVDQLVAFGSKAARGVTFIWDRDAPDAVLQLESQCMELLPIPGLPNTSFCAYSFPEGNPRLFTKYWFASNVVNQDGFTDAWLQCPIPLEPHQMCYDVSEFLCPWGCRGYVEDDCTINIYFVGNAVSQWNWGYTSPPPSVPGWFYDAIVIPDLARIDGFAPARPDQLLQMNDLPHEVACHFLPYGAEHSPDPPAGTCPNDYDHGLCVRGQVLWDCLQQQPPKTMDKVSIVNMLNTLSHNRLNCGVSP